MKNHISDCEHESHDYGCKGPWGDKQTSVDATNGVEEAIALSAIVIACVLGSFASIVSVMFLCGYGKNGDITIAGYERAKMVEGVINA